MDPSVYSVQFLPIVGHKNSNIPLSMQNAASEAHFKLPPGTHMLTITAKTAKWLTADLRQIGADWGRVGELPSGPGAGFRSSTPTRVFVGEGGGHVRLIPHPSSTPWTAGESNDITSLEVISLPVYSTELAGE